MPYLECVELTLQTWLMADAENHAEFARRNASLASVTAFVLVVVMAAGCDGHLSLVIYALSFWHYYLYWLAFYFCAVPLGTFRRDAVATKTVALAALGAAYLAAPPDPVSLVVVILGFLLNAVAARALGADRTYYGHEVAGLPHRQIRAFPYGWVSHPMLAGNMAAFGGTLINADFRREWWPLAVIHVALNLGLLVMELAVTPQRRGTRAVAAGGPAPAARRLSPGAATGLAVAAAGLCGVIGAFFGWAAGVRGGWSGAASTGAIVGAAVAVHAIVMFVCYYIPGFVPDERHQNQTKEIS